MRILIVAALALCACTALAKPRPSSAATVAPAPARPEYVEPADAEAALRASQALVAATALWELERAKLRSKYAIDVDAGEGWDVGSDGRLRIRRASPAPASRK